MSVSGDYKICKDEADAFLQVAEWCEEDCERALGGLMYPFAVNAAFSCELFMKAIMIYNSKQNTAIKGHNLDILFGKLPVDTQTELRNKYRQKFNDELDVILKESGDAFEKWRYAYEQGGSINITKMLTFAQILKTQVDSLK